MMPVSLSPESEPAPSTDDSGRFSPRYTRYALGLLLVVYVFNFVDRSILSILLEPIKKEFELSDTALGLLSGPAFAIFYTFVGLPIARWSDRGNRTHIIALAIFVWSGMTAMTGLVSNFLGLLVARIGVGVGEAGCSPPAHSLLSDYFPPSRRATVLAVYSLGIPIGGGIGFLAGGWIEEFFDWRTAFLVVGTPGILLALLVRLTLREPPRGRFDAPVSVRAPDLSLSQVLRLMNGLKSFRHMAIAAALHAFYGYGAGAFIATFFRRSHEMNAGEIGSWLAAIGITAGAAGTFLGGFLGDRLSVLDQRWYMWVPAVATATFIPFAFLLYLSPNPYVGLVAYLPGSILGGMYLGPTFAMTQTLVPARMRATASAILLFTINIIGLGLGPQGVGILSDLLEPVFGIESLRFALLSTIVVFALWSILHYALAARTLREDLARRDALD